ncbi:MAG: hypothetical protein AVDCRST_MAG76-464, partial [uncultured Acidimicrobiales bacterium]
DRDLGAVQEGGRAVHPAGGGGARGGLGQGLERPCATRSRPCSM